VNGQQAFVRALVDHLERAGIAYMIAGSVGSSLHGRPRATQDIDIVISPSQDQLRDFVASLGDTYYASPEAADEAFRRHTMFNVIDIDSGWKADLIMQKPRPFSREEFERRRRIDLFDRKLWVASPEDVILSKLEWIKGRESDVQYSDALGIAVIHRHNLDRVYLQKWAKTLGVGDTLDRLLQDAKE